MDNPSPCGAQDTLAGLHELARVLRDAKHLSPAVQRELADLVDELTNALTPAPQAGAETGRLAASAAHLAEAIRQRDNETLLARARDRLQETAARAETNAPLVAGLLRRIVEALANLGV
jgi:hypothetical protein